MVKSPASCPVRLQRVMVAPVSSGSAAVYEARTRSVAWFSVNERLCCPRYLRTLVLVGHGHGDVQCAGVERVVHGHHRDLIDVVPVIVYRILEVRYPLLGILFRVSIPW